MSKIPIQSLVRAVLFVQLPLAVLVVIIIGWGHQNGIQANNLTRDVVSIFDGAPYLGIISTFGIMLWCAAVAICFFSASLLRTGNAASYSPARFLFASGGLTMWLMLDDQFLFHEIVCPEHLGIPEQYVYAAYALLTGGYLVAFREAILKHDYPVLLVAGGLLAASIGMDLFISFPGHYIVEDGLKLIGIGTWLWFFGSVARRHLLERARVAPANARA